MRWEMINSDNNQEVYQLFQKDKKLLTVTFHPFSNTARVESQSEKRVFLIRKEGFLRNKTVIRNEYGLRIGEIGFENKERFIDINDERFYYVINHMPEPQLIVYKESIEHPALVCGLNFNSGDTTFHVRKEKKNAQHMELLLALCWYMFLPVKKETPSVTA